MELDVALFEEKKEYKPYSPSKKEKSIIDFVRKRFSFMQQARTRVDVNWSIYQTMIEGIRKPYPDGRSSSNVPLATTLMEQYVAEALKIPTEFNFKGETQKYKANARALEVVREYDWRKNNRKQVMVNDEYLVSGYGTSVIYSGYEACELTQKDFDGVDSKGNFKRKEITFDDSKILLENIDIRNYWIDNRSIKGIEDAVDCIYRQRIAYDTFKNFKNNPLYSNIEFVAPRDYSNEYKTAITQEEAGKTGEYVLLEHYRNIEKDCYIVIANDVFVRGHPMISTINGKKALPFVVRNLGKKIRSIYGRGLCEAALMFNSQLNDLFELIMDGVKRSNTQVLALGNGLSRTGRAFAYDNEVMTFDGDLNPNSFQQISGNPPNQAIFGFVEQVFKNIAVFVGIDITNILGTPNKTAFEVEVQREASQKRINTWLTNRDLAYERLANLHKEVLQMFFPLGSVKEIEVKDEKPVFNSEGVLTKFVKRKGYHLLEIKPETLRGDFFVDVYTNTSATTINAVDRQQKMQALQLTGQIVQSYGIAKQMGYDLDKFLPFEATMKDLFEGFNIPTEEKGDQADVEARRSQILSELTAMQSRGAPTNLDPNQQQGQTPQLPALTPQQPMEVPATA